MARQRFVLRYRGEGPAPPDDVARVRETPGVAVLEVSQRMLLVESDPEALRAVVDSLSGWLLAPEQSYEVPDTRKRVDRPPAQ